MHQQQSVTTTNKIYQSGIGHITCLKIKHRLIESAKQAHKAHDAYVLIERCKRHTIEQLDADKWKVQIFVCHRFWSPSVPISSY